MVYNELNIISYHVKIETVNKFIYTKYNLYNVYNIYIHIYIMYTNTILSLNNSIINNDS